MAEVQVCAAIAPLHADAHVGSGQISQYLAAAPLRVIGERGEWRLVRGLDDYEGWMHRGYVTAANGSVHAELRVSLGCVVQTPRGEPRALPLGARLLDAESVTGGDVIPGAARAARFPAAAEAIVASGLHYFRGTSYQWGGVTPWGADCSGFTQSIFALHGVQLPRDAWQQANAGADAGCDPMSLAPADLLFFSDRADHHITHVGLSLGDGRMAHLSLGRGGYAVENLADERDEYVKVLRKRFRGARRVL